MISKLLLLALLGLALVASAMASGPNVDTRGPSGGSAHVAPPAPVRASGAPPARASGAAPQVPPPPPRPAAPAAPTKPAAPVKPAAPAPAKAPVAPPKPAAPGVLSKVKAAVATASNKIKNLAAKVVDKVTTSPEELNSAEKEVYSAEELLPLLNATAQAIANAEKALASAIKTTLTVGGIKVPTVGGATVPAGTCGAYDGAPISVVAGNGNVQYQVVKVRQSDLTDPSAYTAGYNQKDNTMRTVTACAFDKMRAAAAAARVRITINSAFRTLARQQYFWNCYRTKRCNAGRLAARPGTSNHGVGIALDLNSTGPGVYAWLSANAHKYGFVRTVRSEKWHWEYRPGTPRASYT